MTKDYYTLNLHMSMRKRTSTSPRSWLRSLQVGNSACFVTPTLIMAAGDAISYLVHFCCFMVEIAVFSATTSSSRAAFRSAILDAHSVAIDCFLTM